ncbi:MAG: thioredoxin family protein [Bacilli bacterium]|nr:thioredoxin family protein [Bacilli bacterium]MDD4808689.1 thioredoxin family protein [Bacilli bacterium]
MKKYIIIVISIFLVFILLMNYTKGDIKNINFQEYEQLISDQEDFILVLGQENCNYCKDYLSKLNRVIRQYKVTFNYLDIELLNKNEKTKLESKINFEATPTTIFIFDGEEKTKYDRITGTADYDYIIKRLIKTEYIKEA